MKKVWLALIVAAALAAARPSSACDLMYRVAFPSPDTVRLTGTVVDYIPIVATAVAAPAWQAGRQLAGLRIAVLEMVSGPMVGSETVVAPMFYGPDCMSYAASREMLERDYPLGSKVAVRGRTTDSRDVPVIAESNKQQFVAKIPDTLYRTSEGDLDFREWGVTISRDIVDFEFDRAVLTLARRSGDRSARLRNLARYKNWGVIPDARTRYRQLVGESGLGTRERTELLEQFQQLFPYLK
jgi:hypothetical protein